MSSVMYDNINKSAENVFTKSSVYAIIINKRVSMFFIFRFRQKSHYAIKLAGYALCFTNPIKQTWESSVSGIDIAISQEKIILLEFY